MECPGWQRASAVSDLLPSSEKKFQPNRNRKCQITSIALTPDVKPAAAILAELNYSQGSTHSHEM